MNVLRVPHGELESPATVAAGRRVVVIALARVASDADVMHAAARLLYITPVVCYKQYDTPRNGNSISQCRNGQRVDDRHLSAFQCNRESADTLMLLPVNLKYTRFVCTCVPRPPFRSRLRKPRSIAMSRDDTKTLPGRYKHATNHRHFR